MDQFLTVLSMIGTLLLMVAVFVGAYYVSKLIAKKYQPDGIKSAKHIKLIERAVLGKDQSLLIVRVADEVLLLGSTPQGITKIDQLASEDFPQADDRQSKEPSGFLQMLSEAYQNKLGSKTGGADHESNP